MAMSNVNGLGNKITGDLTQLVGSLGKRADGNGDGQVSTAEFAQFLTSLMDKPADAQATPALSSDAGISAALATIGRILSKFAPNPAGLSDAMPAIQQALPGTTLQGRDHLDIPGVGRVNVGLSFGNSGGSIWRGGAA
jgi:hypothetical protein